MSDQIDAHEIERVDDGWFECEYCGTQATYRSTFERHDCLFGREKKLVEE